MKANKINLSISDAREDDTFIISYTFNFFFKNKKTNLKICLTKDNKSVLYLKITMFILCMK